MPLFSKLVRIRRYVTSLEIVAVGMLVGLSLMGSPSLAGQRVGSIGIVLDGILTRREGAHSSLHCLTANGVKPCSLKFCFAFAKSAALNGPTSTRV